MNQINSQLLILLIFIALSAGSWVMNALREQARIKRARDAAKRRYEEELRTGRAPQEKPPVLVDSGDRFKDLAERRQAQLRELRRQQDAARAGGQPQPRPQQQQQGTRIIIARQPGQTAQRPGAPVPVPTPAPRQAPTAPQRPTTFPQARPARQAPARPAPPTPPALPTSPHDAPELAPFIDEQSPIGDPVSVSTRPDAARRLASANLRALLVPSHGATRASLRSLIAAAEILDKPLSLRDQR